MLLEELLLREQSRANTDLLVNIVLRKPELFNELWAIVMQNEGPLSRRAAWVADYCAEINPGFLENRLEELSIKVNNFSSDGLKRYALRMLSRSVLPVENLGYLVDACFKWLENRTESVAVKMCSMVILGRYASNYPN
jgi:hypothetical protein